MVTFAGWLVDELAAGGAANSVRVIGHDGLDLPAGIGRTAWWCPGRFADRLAATGCRHRFATPGPAFWDNLDAPATGRPVWCGPLSDLPDWPGPMFAKAADTKIPGLPAGVHRDRDGFRTAAFAAGLGPDSSVVVSAVVAFVREWRFWILDRAPVASSVYLADGATWDASGDLPVPAVAARLAARVAARTDGMPAGWVLDIGQTRDVRTVVVEANPAWSSNPYWASARDPDAVVATILASQGPASGGSRWRDDRPHPPARPLPRRREPIPGPTSPGQYGRGEGRRT